jgi:hypothetical protein
MIVDTLSFPRVVSVFVKYGGFSGRMDSRFCVDDVRGEDGLEDRRTDARCCCGGDECAADS